MHHDVGVQEVIEGFDITRVTSSEPAGNDGRGLLHPRILYLGVLTGTRTGTRVSIRFAHQPIR